MKELNVVQMEEIEGGSVLSWIGCATAVGGTIVSIGAVFAITGPAAAAAGWWAAGHILSVVGMSSCFA